MAYAQIRDDRVTVIVFSDEGVRICTDSGLNYKAALEMVMLQNSIGRQAIVVPDAPISVGMIRNIDEARAAVKALGRLKFN